jgi:hypothetical protein
MYSKGYKRLFWGMLLIIFNINIGFINILPDFAGYILIYSGLNILSSQNQTYQKAKIPAVILMILTLKNLIYDPNSNILSGQIYDLGLIAMIIGTIVDVIKIYLIYILCNGICELCNERELKELMNFTNGSWKFYLITSVLCLLFVPFSINLYMQPRIAVSAILGIVYIIAALLVAGVFRSCNKVLNM